jgi:predicted amidophosphoribosyltransferase
MNTCKNCGAELRENDVALCKTCRQNASEAAPVQEVQEAQPAPEPKPMPTRQSPSRR